MASKEKFGLEGISGINNVDELWELTGNEMREALNLDVTDRGSVRSRDGYAQLLAGDYRSLGSSGTTTLVVVGEELHQLADDLSGSTLIRTGLARTRHVSYASRGDAIYYANGDVSGLVVGGTDFPWASQTPVDLGSLTVSAVGGLQPGTYHVALTEVDSLGRESGAAHVGSIALTTQGGINLSNLTAVANETRVYVTTADGETFYLYAALPAGSIGTLITEIPRGRTLQTKDLYPLPAGQIIANHRGRLLSAEGSTLWYEEAFTNGLCRKSKNFISFNEEITMVAPVENGVFVSADATYFLAGTDPQQYVVQWKGEMKTVPGTVVTVPGKEFKSKGVDSQADVVMWTSNTGVYVGFDSGTINNLTEERYSYSVGERGAAMFRRKDGTTQYVSVLKEPSDGKENLAVTDNVVAEVYRNGILIT